MLSFLFRGNSDSRGYYGIPGVEECSLMPIEDHLTLSKGSLTTVEADLTPSQGKFDDGRN